VSPKRTHFRQLLLLLGVPLLCAHLAFANGTSSLLKRHARGREPGATVFHDAALIQSGGHFRFPIDGRLCVDFSVVIAHSTFFEGLRRDRGPNSEWRYSRAGRVVERFPDSLSVEIRAVPTYCADERTPPFWTSELVDFMRGLRFVFSWVETGQFRPAEIWSEERASLLPEGGAWALWRYCFDIGSVKVPISDDLSVEVCPPAGPRLVRVIGGMDRASPVDWIEHPCACCD